MVVLSEINSRLGIKRDEKTSYGPFMFSHIDDVFTIESKAWTTPLVGAYDEFINGSTNEPFASFTELLLLLSEYVNVESYQDLYTKYGEISSLNGMVEIDCAGTASATISVSGTFTGTLTVTGSGSTVAENGIQGGRLLFKSGVGSLGANWVKHDTSTGDAEYRVNTGGKSLRVKMTSYESGTAKIKIAATVSPSIVFVNGPVHNALEEAVRAGRAYSAGTGFQAVSGSNYLKYRFYNPIDSGVNCFVTLRKTITATTSQFLTSQLVLDPDPITGGINATPANLRNGSPDSVVQFSWKYESTPLVGGTVVGGLPIPLNGVALDIEVLRLVQPGELFGYQIQGAGGPLSQAILSSMALIWYEETIN